MKILIIGGFGFIGARIAKALSYDDNIVYITTRNINKLNNIKLIKYDLLNSNSNKLIEILKKIDLIIYAAGVSAKECKENENKCNQINGNCVQKIIKIAIECNVKKFIYFSTVHVYSYPLNGIIKKNTSTKNDHPYAKSHLLGESIVKESIKTNKIDCLILRLSNTFGVPEVERSSAWTPFINEFCKQAIKDKKIIIYGSGKEMRDVISLDNLCEFLRNIINIEWNNNSILIENVCSGNSYSVKFIANYIKNKTKILYGYSPDIIINNIESKINEKPIFLKSKFINKYFPKINNLDEIEKILKYLNK